MSVIKVDNLSKNFKIEKKINGNFFNKINNYFFPSYETLEAINNLNFKINQNERVAFIGPNGAGKSTTIKILTGIMQPTSGSVKILKKDPIKDRKKLAYKISVIFGHCSKLWLHLPVIESLDLLSAIYEIPLNEYKKTRDSLIDLFLIGKFLHKPVRQLSLGERMRCELVASFIHKPKVIFLDEPTIGLDISAKAIMRNLLRDMCENWDCTLLLTSHDAHDIEIVCDRVILINKGKCVIDSSLENMLKNIIKKKIITVLFEKINPFIEMEGINIVERMPYKVKFEIDLKTITESYVVQMLMKKHKILDITIERPSLETIIKTFYN
ncbi:MAG: ABC transporter ATP-binding protein NatA [Candidatus Anoxychlamydiales bacterium]|nr:ABC transporter ATP-binding protein NatA [Candidatus Anoxychlamydiales bacterium]